jgi:Na+-transporting NADH:ubiquinone oxidoreductase subunit NqrF
MENVLVKEMNNEVVMGLRKATREDNWLELTCFVVNIIEELEFGYTLAYTTFEDYKTGKCFEEGTALYCYDEDSCWDNLWKITGVQDEADEYDALEKQFKNIHYVESLNTLVFTLKNGNKFVALRM